MQISARNILEGRVIDVRQDAVAAQVQVEIGGGDVVTSTVTADSAQRLGLTVGKDVLVIVKASDVILGVAD